jgi:tRNA pseudouridine13 synthase
VIPAAAPALPLLTAALPGTGGTLKDRPEDFVVDEIPLYPALGVGDHAYARIEKIGIPTREAIRRLAAHLGVAESAIGCAGLKDARAVTRQTLSLEHVPPARLEGLVLPGIRVLSVKRHRNKLRPGHLAGNRFEIRLRGVVPDAPARTEAILRVLLARGLPNAFGPQRFGTRGDTHLVGAAILRRDWAGAVALLCGRPSPRERDPRVLEARRLFDAGDFAGARSAFPVGFATERRVLDRLAGGGSPEQAVKGIPKPVRRFYVSALQSALFNGVLAARLDAIDRLEAGDLAWIHGKGAVFRVEDAAREQPRCDAFEVSPSGPLFGTKMVAPTGAPGEREAAALAASGLAPAAFAVAGVDRFEGERRPLRVPVGEPVFRAEGEDLHLAFSLPRGSYATCLLAEVMKAEADVPGDG